jgi:hypothetical protein
MAKQNKSTEKEIERSIVDYLRLKGFWAEAMQSGSIAVANANGGYRRVNMCSAGVPDVIACVRGVFLGIEVKKDAKEIAKWRKQSDKRSQDQHRQKDMIMGAGGKFLIVSSVEDVVQDLHTLGLT